jgi:hypothetical protein
MVEKMTLEKLALITAHGFEELRAEFRAEMKNEMKNMKLELKAEIAELRKEMRAEFKLVHQEIKLLREICDQHERRISRLEEKVL